MSTSSKPIIEMTFLEKKNLLGDTVQKAKVGQKVKVGRVFVHECTIFIREYIHFHEYIPFHKHIPFHKYIPFSRIYPLSQAHPLPQIYPLSRIYSIMTLGLMYTAWGLHVAGMKVNI